MSTMEVFNGTRIGAFLQTILYLTGVPVYQEAYNSVISSRDGLNETRCYGDLGCIEAKHTERRGFYLFPEELETIKPNICLFIFDAECQLVTGDNLKELNFSNGTTAFWITHGYFENGGIQWIKELTFELLSYDNTSNIFVVDWAIGAQPPYTQATVNIELLAVYTANIMMLLQNVTKLKVEDAHFIGHSLGAHFAGFVGSCLKEKGFELGRISGLDPAQPYFENFPEDIRLDPSDALFVDVIHTDAKPLLQGGSLSGLGSRDASGHADFWPNNGKDQPGCGDGVYQAIIQENSLLSGMRRFFGCDHIRAYEYFTESIRSKCNFTAFKCDSWDDFVNATCSISCNPEDYIKCNRMGLHAKKPKENTIYYSITGARKDYCRNHFVIIIDAENNEPSITNQEVNIYTGNKYLLSLDLKRRQSFKETVGGSNRELREKIIIRPNLSSPFNWFRRSSFDLLIKSVSITNLESSSHYLYCPEYEGYNSFTLTTGACKKNHSAITINENY